jgi:hypothetical protein
MKNINFKSLLPHLIAVIAFIVVTLAYLHPLLEGKVVYQGDITNYTGMSKEIKDFREKTGEEPLWTNSMFGGMPAYQISVLYPNNLVKYVDTALQLGLPRPANYLFILMLGFYFLLIMLKVDYRLSIAGAFAFALASYSVIIIEAGHNSKLHAMAYMAPVIGSILLAYRGKLLLGAALTALFLAIQISTNHLQITYYLLLTILILGLVKLIYAVIEKTIPQFMKATGLLVTAAVIAVLPNITNLWATYEYGQYTMRGKSDLSSELAAGKEGLSQKYATDWSYGIGETMTLLIPNFKGGGSNGELGTRSETYKALIDNKISKGQATGIIKNLPLYWGDQPFTSGPVYLGAIICFLFVLGLFTIKGNDKWWLLGAAILSIVLSWGRNFPPVTNFFFEYFPGYNKFRAVSMTLVIAQFVFPVMALLALKNIFSGEIHAAELKKKLIYSLSIVGGITLLFVLMPGMFFDFVSASDERYAASGFPEWLVDAIREDRKSLLSSDALRSLVFILLSGGVIWLFMMDKLKKEIAMPLFIILVLADMLPVDYRYLNKSNFVNKNKAEKPFTPTQADKYILEDKALDFRVFNLSANTFNDASTSYFHKSIGGYHGAKLKRYQELIDQHVSKNNMRVLNMLNTKYVIVPGEEGQPARPQQNPGALGNAWFVEEYKLVANADSENSEITALNTFEPQRSAIVDRLFESELKDFTPQKDSAAQIKMTDYKPNHLSYASKASSEQLAVFSEIYYDKGWNAYIDGKLTPYFRANFVLRAMRIPAGEHKVEFKFEPATYYTGEKIALAGSILLFLFVGAAIFFSRKDAEAQS